MPTSGAPPAIHSVAAGLLALAIGGLGTPLAISLAEDLDERTRLTLVCAPAVVAAGMGGIGAIAGSVAARRSTGWPGVLGLLGASLGSVSALGAVAWLLFVGWLAWIARGP